MSSRILVHLDEVYCSDTEDVTGADEFYILGAITTADGSIRRPIVLSPISINDGQSYSYGGYAVFDAVVPDNAVLNVEFYCFDEDTARDASRYAQAFQVASQALAATPLNFYGAASSAVINAFNGVIGLDQDDQLYQPYLQGFPVWQQRYGDNYYQFFSTGSNIAYYSDWSYRLRFRVARYQA